MRKAERMAILKGQLTIFRCAWCDQVMVDGRIDKKCCSPVCRKRWSRWKQKVDKLEVRAAQALSLLDDYLKHYATRDRAAQAVKRIETQAKRALVENHVQAVS
jgi:hypothetical protein